MPAQRRVLIVAFDEVQALDVVGPAEVFSMASRWGMANYDVSLVTPGGTSIGTAGGLRLEADGDVYSVRGAIDTLVVAGGPGTRAKEKDPKFLAQIAALALRSRRVTSVCTGALVLAAAGLLDGRRATTHWSAYDELDDRYPDVTVERDPIFVRDGHITTSAGITTGMDLALALVEEDYGRELALGLARGLVMFMRRPGGQSQFSAQLAAHPAEREPLRELQAWIPEHLDEDLSVPRARRPRVHERAQLRPRLPPRDRDDARRPRRGGPGRARPHRARDDPAPGRDDRRPLWLWLGRDDAPRLPPPPGRRPGGLSKPLPARPRRAGGRIKPQQTNTFPPQETRTDGHRHPPV